jgi:hypothetical protein
MDGFKGEYGMWFKGGLVIVDWNEIVISFKKVVSFKITAT